VDSEFKDFGLLRITWAKDPFDITYILPIVPGLVIVNFEAILYDIINNLRELAEFTKYLIIIFNFM